MSSVGDQSTPAPSPASAETLQRTRQKMDPAWNYCKLTGIKNTVICNYCEKVIKGGGITRLKQHLACISGDVTSCVKVPYEIQHKMEQDIVDYQARKKRAAADYVDAFGDEYETVGEPLPSKASTKKNKKNPVMDSYFPQRTTSGSQPSIKSVMQTKEAVEKCDLAISKWMIDASIPFNAVNSIFYQPMIDAIASMGAGYKGPRIHALRNYLLAKNVQEAQNFVDSYRSIWKNTGCTIMADGWSDTCRRTLINFLVYCPRGMVFLKSVDASDASKTADNLYKLFRDVVLFVGPENVVHMVTDNAANYVAAGRLLEAEFPTLYWSPCAAHCVNLMLQDMGKLDEVSKLVDHGAKITKYVYNHCYPLYLMRKFTHGREIVRPAPTRFATNFIALQSILQQKDGLRAMVTSREWTTCAYAKESKGRRFVDLVLDSVFWKECAIIVQLTEPLIRVLRLVDSEDKPAMGYMYNAIQVARGEMVQRFQRNRKRADPYLSILDSRWDRQLHKNLHAAGYWLNPKFQYKEDGKQMQTVSGVIDVIEKYSYGKSRLTSMLTSEMKSFRCAEGDFGRKVAIRDRNRMMPDEWWMCYGSMAPNLQKLAIRVLSQTCSASGCERNWSIFEHIHSKKRNRLEHQRLNDLVYAHYNLRLQQRNRFMRGNTDPIALEVFDDLEDWVTEDEPPTLTVDELEAFRKAMASCSINDERDTQASDGNDINLEDYFDDDASDGNNVEMPSNVEVNSNSGDGIIDMTIGEGDGSHPWNLEENV